MQDTELLRSAEKTLAAPGLAEAISAALSASTDARASRTAAAQILVNAKNEANATLRAAFTASPLDALTQTRAQADLTDALVRASLAIAIKLHPLPNPIDTERLAVLGVGGYGRAEMAPHSDVDLLFLYPWRLTPWAENIIECHALRPVGSEAEGRPFRRARSKTASGLAARISPSAPPCWNTAMSRATPIWPEELDIRLWSDLFRNTGREFIEAKLAERGDRHKRQGGQRYVLEPNVKEAKGGLRDLQTLYWIGKYLHRVASSEGSGSGRPADRRGIWPSSAGPRTSSGPRAATCTTSPAAPPIN